MILMTRLIRIQYTLQKAARRFRAELAAAGFFRVDDGDADRVKSMIGNTPRRAAIGRGTLDGSRWIGQLLPEAITRPEGSPRRWRK